MHIFSRMLNYFNGWEYIGTDSYNENGKVNLSKHVHKDILTTLNRKARDSLWSNSVYAKGRTFLYKAEPAGNWFINHGHGGGYLHIYRKVRKN